MKQQNEGGGRKGGITGMGDGVDSTVDKYIQVGWQPGAMLGGAVDQLTTS